MVKGKVVKSWDPHKRRSDSEFQRGYRYGKKSLGEYRSLWIENGWIFGYTRKGIKHKMYPVDDSRYRTNNFDGGHAKAIREALKERPKKTVHRAMVPS